jgi:sugar-specific transcriptional regulator TrmB
MSQRRVLETIVGLGFSEKDAEVYVFLAKKGSRKAREIMTGLKMNKAQLYRSLKSLQSRGLVDSTLECPARFGAVAFDKVLDLFIKAKKDEARGVEENRASTLSMWNSMLVPESSALSDRFMVVEGSSYIFSKINQMIGAAKKEVLVSTSGPGFVRAEAADVFQSLINQNVTFRILTNVSLSNILSIKQAVLEMKACTVPCSGRHVDLAEKVFPMFVLKDEDEVMFFISSQTDEEDGNGVGFAGLWTNNGAMVRAFRTFFEQMWVDAADFERKLDELENGYVAPDSVIIRDAESAYGRFLDLMRSAQEDIIIMTSSKGLVKIMDNPEMLEGWRRRKVTVRVMAPIISENMAFAQALQKFCRVRQIAETYLSVAAVDGKHLFNFRTPLQEEDPCDLMNYFGSSFYTNDPEFVRGRVRLLDDIWKHSSDLPV